MQNINATQENISLEPNQTTVTKIFIPLVLKVLLPFVKVAS